MATAAYQTVLKAPASGSTAMADEATTVVTPNTVYQVTASAKRILDPNTAVTVKVNGSPVADSTYTINYAFGTITFAADQGAATVTVSGAYLSLLSFAEAKDVTLTLIRELLEKTSFDSGGWKQRVSGEKDFSLEIGSLTSLLYDLDPGAGTQRVWDLLDSGSPFLVEIEIAGETKYFRGWVLPPEGTVKGSVGALDELTLKLEAAVFAGASSASQAVWGFGTP